MSLLGRTLGSFSPLDAWTAPSGTLKVSPQLQLRGLWALCLKCMVSSSVGTYLPPLSGTKDKSRNLQCFGKLLRSDSFSETQMHHVWLSRSEKILPEEALSDPLTELFNTVDSGCQTQLDWTHIYPLKHKGTSFWWNHISAVGEQCWQAVSFKALVKIVANFYLSCNFKWKMGNGFIYRLS